MFNVIIDIFRFKFTILLFVSFVPFLRVLFLLLLPYFKMSIILIFHLHHLLTMLLINTFSGCPGVYSMHFITVYLWTLAYFSS